MRALALMNAQFLAEAKCYFGGGTRIVLALDEYRESAVIDFLCASQDGYRALRSTVTTRSLGRIGNEKLKLAREVIADRYGIRTFVEIDGAKLKLELILEGRIELAGGTMDKLPVPALDPVSCCAEKILANADRGGDVSFAGRDIIDLAFMATHWGREPLAAGLAVAAGAYGRAAKRDLKRAATRMLEHADWRRRCVAMLDITDTRTMIAGLRLLTARKW
jgi:hypothetical protein